MRGMRILAAALALCAIAPAYASAAPGDLDPGFSRDGKTSVDIDGCESGRAVAVQPDGKILVAGTTAPLDRIYCDFLRTSGVVVRLLPNGRLDRAFGTDGVARLPGDTAPTAIALQGDGKIVAGGSSRAFEGRSGVVRLLPSGAVDPSFGAGGAATVSGFAIRALTTDPAGRVVAGGAQPSCPGSCVAVARLNGDGSQDSAFGGGDGIAAAPIPGVYAEARRVVVLPDGRIFAAGWHAAFGAAFARFTDAGELDPTFSGDGIQATRSPGSQTFGSANSDAVVQPDGGAISVGQVSERIGATRIDSAGELVPSFGSQGFATAQRFTPKEDVAWANGAALGPGGSVLASGTTARVVLDPGSGGRSDTTAAEDFALARFTETGGIDDAFGKRGGRAVDFWTGSDLGVGGVRTPDGRYVMAGIVEDGRRQLDFGVARFLEAPGRADADADGLKDSKDHCPEAFARGNRGCPLLRRELEFRYLEKRGRFNGSVESRWVRCVDGNVKVQVMKVRSGRDKVLSRESPNFLGRFSVKASSPRGRFYARMRELDLTIRGDCEAVRTPAITLP